MHKSKKNWVLLGIVVLAVFFIIRIALVTLDEREGYTNKGKTFCTSRSEFCTENYSPVCGWYNPSKIQCIKYPCAQTFSNGCFACGNQDVEYYTQGECPK